MASIASCPEARKQTQPIMSGSQIQPLDCRGVSPSANAETRLTAKKRVPDEQHDGAEPLTPAGLVCSTSASARPPCQLLAHQTDV